MKIINSVDTSGRIASIDVLRGVAIMGILLVNGPTLNGPASKDMVDFAFQNGLADAWYTKFIFAIFMGKFYPIFACLFGVSAAIFLDPKKDHVAILWLRRLVFLLIIGMAHATFVWWGDILIVYSLLGVVLLTLNQKPAEVILRIFRRLFLLVMLLSCTSAFLPIEENETTVFINNELYQKGSFLAISKQRVFDYYGVFIPGVFHDLDSQQILNFAIYYLQLVLMFILGFYLSRSQLLMSLNSHPRVAKKAFFLTLGCAFFSLVLQQSFDIADRILSYWQGILQALLYGSALMLLCQNRKLREWLLPLAKVGRMSLSNYIFHTTTLSLLFYGYGLGLYGRMGPLMQLPILLGLMVVSMLLSSLWLSYFPYGPLEWLWRKAVHGKFITFGRSNESVK